MPPALQSAISPANILFAMGALLVTFVLLRRTRRYFQRLANEPRPGLNRDRTPGNSADTNVLPPSVRREVLQGQVQLHETARDLMGQLDAKMSGLQVLIRLAEEASSRLEAATHRAERLGISARPDELDDLAQLPDHDPATAQRLLDDLSDRPARRLRFDQGEQAEMVLDMARNGQDPHSIARDLGLPIGDVEMLLSLHGR